MRLPPAIVEFMDFYGVTSDEVWLVPGGKTYAVKHAALERISYERKISFGLPQIIESDAASGVVSMIVTATMGEHSTWSIGEASPKNNRNAYCYAMAEKRAKDRCILKLLQIHGTIYSEDEDEDLRSPPKEELIPASNDTFQGNGKPKAANALKKEKPGRWAEIVEMMRAAEGLDELREIGAMIKGEVEEWPSSWRTLLSDEYKECESAIREKLMRGAA